MNGNVTVNLQHWVPGKVYCIYEYKILPLSNTGIEEAF